MRSSKAPHQARPRQSFTPYRLRRRADYLLVYAASRKYHTPSASFFFRVRQPGEQPPCGPRFGLTCPRALGPAVVRNRIKRRMRELLRLHAEPLLAPGLPGVDLVLHPRAIVANSSFASLESEISDLLRRVARMAPSGPEPPRPLAEKRDKRKRPQKQ